MFGRRLGDLPWLTRILAENVLRRQAGGDVAAAARLFTDPAATGGEIEVFPRRVLMHDTTSLPALVDIAAMRDVVAAAGGDPAALNPRLPVDVSVDHSVAVDHFGAPDALARNMAREIARNGERYRMMKWAAGVLRDFRVHAPGTGIMHTMNLEQLATVIAPARIDGVDWVVPDLMIGTDSHTPMVNGLGVLAWGVGGIEAESVLFGEPLTIPLPAVVGVRLHGRLPSGVLSTDLALAVTERLRGLGVVGAFVEFFGPGVAGLSAGDRAVVANMAPEYGATSGYFPIDRRSLDYLRATGRTAAAVDLVERAAKRMGLWFDPEAVPRYARVEDIDLAALRPSLAGPRRPQDRLAPAAAPAALATLAGRPLDRPGAVPDGAVAIAAITSCTNTSDPRLLVAAGLLARAARRRGLKPPAWVKTSLAPGSPAARRFLARAGLLDDLAALGFDIVGFGCTTCIGNSGPLVPAMAAAIDQGVVAAAVLSGNRNFPGRVHPRLGAGFLASPPLVVAYALAGAVDRDILTAPLGRDRDGRPVTLSDLWPDAAAVDAALTAAVDPADFADAFAEAEAHPLWAAVAAPDMALFPWDAASTYLRPPPFVTAVAVSRLGRYRAHPLLVLDDDVTTDHISPAGAIDAGSAAGRHLTARGADPADLNVFAARRGNWEAMLRGLFTNRTVVNRLAEGLPPGSTVHAPSGDVLPLFAAAERYAAAGAPVVVVGGARFGTGSSRDWAAKGLALLGVRAVIAESFERIHRSNLIGMGILPVTLPAGVGPAELGLAPGDRLDIAAPADRLAPGCPVPLALWRTDGTTRPLTGVAAVTTQREVALLAAGGVIPTILRRALGTVRSAP